MESNQTTGATMTQAPQIPAYVSFTMRDHAYTATVHSIEDLVRWCYANHHAIVSFSIERAGSLSPDAIKNAVFTTKCTGQTQDSTYPCCMNKPTYLTPQQD